MLESIFLFVMATGVIMFVLAIERENIIYSATSLLMWLIVMAGHIAIEVPHEADTYYEPFLFAVSIAFVIINIIWMILMYVDFSYWKQQP